MLNLYDTITIATNSLVSVIGTLGNAVMIITYLCRHEVRATSNWFTVTTFFIGEFISIVLYPFQMLVDISIINNNPGCIIAATMGLWLATSLNLNVLALTVERYISICMPLRAPTMLTVQRIGTAIIAIFIYSTFFSFLIPFATPIGFKGNISEVANGCRLSSVVPNRGYVSFMFANVLLPIPVMIIIYCRIYQVLRRHIRAVADLNVVQPKTAQGEQDDVTAAIAAANNGRRLWKREAKSALLLFVIVMSFVICWMPFVIFILYRSFNSYVSPLTYALIHAVVYSTAAVNPLVHGYGNKTYRQAVMSVFCGPLIKMYNRNRANSLNE